MQLPAGADRRIIRAFYTQYVAVLLIVLTFAIGAFQRSSMVRRGAFDSKFLPRSSAVGSITMKGVFTKDGELSRDHGQLESIAEVLENHDLKALIELSVSRLDFDEQASSLRRTLRRLNSLERFFEHRAIPTSAITFVAQRTADGAEDISVRFFNDEGV